MNRYFLHGESEMNCSGQLRIGTSGWVYKHWLDIFYPRSLPGSEQLPFYAKKYDTVAFCRDRIDVYLYFNNDPEGHALRDADRIMKMLQA